MSWRDALSPEERAILNDPQVAALDEAQQRAYLAQNRRVGFFVTAFAGGVSILFIIGGGVSAVAFAFERDDWLLELMGSPLLVFGAWCAWRWWRRLQSLRSRG